MIICHPDLKISVTLIARPCGCLFPPTYNYWASNFNNGANSPRSLSSSPPSHNLGKIKQSKLYGVPLRSIIIIDNHNIRELFTFPSYWPVFPESKSKIMNPVSRKKREQRSAGGSIRNFGGPIGYVAPKSPVLLMNNNHVDSYYSFTNNSLSAKILPLTPVYV